MTEFRSFEEEEDHKIEEEEEEEEVGELIVIDDELIEMLINGIQSTNPIQIAQAVDVIIGFLGYKQNVVADESLEQSPLISILTHLVPKLNDIYQKSKEGTVKQKKVVGLLEKLSAGVFDSFDKFKKELPLYEIFCNAFATMNEFVDEKVADKAFKNAAVFGLQKEKNREIVFKLFSNLLKDAKFKPTVLQMQYSELIKSNDHATFENLLPKIIDFYLANSEEVLPYVKSLVKRLSSELINTMAKSDKSLISWRALATIQLVSRYMIETKERRLVYPVLLILTSFLRHFPIKVYLPFQIRIANITHSVSQCFNAYAPVLCWVTDAIQFICSVNCKGGSKFNWETTLTSPDHLTFEFCHGALDQLKRIFLSNMLSECESIAFPEYVMPIKSRLESIIATNSQLSAEIKVLVNQINEQQKCLLDIKNEIEWTTRQEQISAFQKVVSEKSTPLKTTLSKQSKIDAAKEKMKVMNKKQVDITGDLVEVATADDV